MIYFCADDYGLCKSMSAHIQECIDDGMLDKVSIFPNFDEIDFDRIRTNKKIRISLHLNLVEGKCMSEPRAVDIISDKEGNFRHAFFGLFCLWLFWGKKFEEQVYEEIKTQVRYWKNMLPEDVQFCIDSHQHVHMIPGVFNALLKVLKEERVSLTHLRIPAEPFIPYLKTPSLYFTYNPVNLLKQWLLKFLWLINKGKASKYNIPTAYFMGILFSGKMDEKRVSRILPEYVKIAERDNRDIEVLFHPGYVEDNKCELKNKNIVFEKFYLSKNRKTEFDSIRNCQKEVKYNAVY